MNCESTKKEREGKKRKKPTKRERNKEKRRMRGRETLEVAEQAGSNLRNLAINLQSLEEAERNEQEIQKNMAEIEAAYTKAKESRRALRKKEQEIKQNLADLQASYTKAQERRRDGRKRKQEIKQNVTELKDAYMKAQEITKARRKGVKTSVQRIHKLDQLVAHNHEDKKMIAYMRNQGWKGSSSNHMEFDSQDEEEVCEPNKQISAKSNYNLENQPSGDPNMHFVESPAALAPPEVHMDMVAQKQHKAKHVAAASQPVPDDDDDSSE